LKIQHTGTRIETKRIDIERTGCNSSRIWYDTIYLLTAIALSPGGSSTVHIYTLTIHRTTQNKQYTEQHNNLGECGPCPVLASYTLAFALQMRKKHGKTSKHGKIYSTTVILSSSIYSREGNINPRIYPTK